MKENNINSTEFEINSPSNARISFKYKQLVNTPGGGTLNPYQKANLSEIQKNKIKNDKKTLGGE
jgi:hypothetical protein